MIREDSGFRTLLGWIIVGCITIAAAGAGLAFALGDRTTGVAANIAVWLTLVGVAGGFGAVLCGSLYTVFRFLKAWRRLL